MNEKLLDLVVQLHDVARTIEQEIGTGQLSADIRSAANRLNAILSPIKDSK